MKKKSIILFAGLLLFAFPDNIFPQLVGSPAPDFTLTTNEDSSFRLSDHQGRVVFIFFFGYGCPHCLANGNNTETGIYEVFKDNADFVAIGIDTWDGNSAGVANFQTSTGISYPLCLKGSDIEELYQTTYDRIVVIDREGIIRYKSTANATSEVVNTAAEIISSLLISTGIDNASGLTDLIVYPVPAVERIFVRTSSNKAGNALIRIINPSGQIVISQPVAVSQSGIDEYSISVESLKPGLYFLQFADNEVIRTARVLIAYRE